MRYGQTALQTVPIERVIIQNTSGVYLNLCELPHLSAHKSIGCENILECVIGCNGNGLRRRRDKLGYGIKRDFTLTEKKIGFFICAVDRGGL